MGIFTREQFANNLDDDAGVFIEHLGRSLVTWAAMQDRDPLTVVDAAQAFNTTPEIIREAISDASWIYTVGDIIELDGE